MRFHQRYCLLVILCLLYGGSAPTDSLAASIVFAKCPFQFDLSSVSRSNTPEEFEQRITESAPTAILSLKGGVIEKRFVCMIGKDAQRMNLIVPECHVNVRDLKRRVCDNAIRWDGIEKLVIVAPTSKNNAARFIYNASDQVAYLSIEYIAHTDGWTGEALEKILDQTGSEFHKVIKTVERIARY